MQRATHCRIAGSEVGALGEFRPRRAIRARRCRTRMEEARVDLGLQGKVAIVTGATGDMGAACAEALAAEGANVAIMARSADKLQSIASAIGERHGTEVLAFPGDLTRVDDIARLLETVEAKWGTPEVLCAITGRPPRHLREVLDENDPERWEDAYRTNLLAAVNLLSAVAPRMVANGRGRIVVVTSASVKQPMPKHGLSTIFRAGVAAYVKHLANEIAHAGVTVNAVGPASIATASFVQRADLKERTENCPVRRLGRPEELAAAVAFLSSEQAGFITGVTLQVDGGMTLSLV